MEVCFGRFNEAVNLWFWDDAPTRREGSFAITTFGKNQSVVFTVHMVYTLDMVYTIDTVDTVDTVYNIQTALHCLPSSMYAYI